MSIVTQQDLHNQRKTGHIAEPTLRLGEEVHTSLTDHKQPCNVSKNVCLVFAATVYRSDFNIFTIAGKQNTKDCYIQQKHERAPLY